MQSGHIWFTDCEFLDENKNSMENISFLQTIYVRFCPEAKLWKTSLVRGNKWANAFAN
jgi:hypothetical protein